MSLASSLLSLWSSLLLLLLICIVVAAISVWLAWSLLFVFLLLLLLLVFIALLVSSFMRFAQPSLLLEGDMAVEGGWRGRGEVAMEGGRWRWGGGGGGGGW